MSGTFCYQTDYLSEDWFGAACHVGYTDRIVGVSPPLYSASVGTAAVAEERTFALVYPKKSGVDSKRGETLFVLVKTTYWERVGTVSARSEFFGTAVRETIAGLESEDPLPIPHLRDAVTEFEIVASAATKPMHSTGVVTVSACFGIFAFAVEEITAGSSFVSMRRQTEHAIDWKDVETDFVQSVAGVKPMHQMVFETDSACYEIFGSADGEKPGSEVVMMQQ